MKTKILVMMAAMTLCALTLSAKELSKVIFRVDKMTCEKCEAKVRENMRFEKGVKEIAVDLKTKHVTIGYDDTKTNISALIKGFAKFNYTAIEVPQQKN